MQSFIASIVLALASSQPCADLDGSGKVDVFDLLELLAHWGPCECDADLDGNGTVNVLDLLTMLGQWGEADCAMTIPQIVFDETLGDLTVDGVESSAGSITLPSVDALAGEHVFLHVGGWDANGDATEVDSATFDPLSFARFADHGAGRRLGALLVGIEDDTEATPFADMVGESLTLIHAQAGRISGATDENPIGDIQTDGQSNATGRSATVTTTTPDALIVAFILKSNTEAITPDGTVVKSTDSNRFITLTKEAPTVGEYTIGASWSSLSQATLIAYEVRSVEPDEPDPDPEFEAESVASHKFGPIAKAIVKPKLNAVLFGDSIVAPWSDLRYTAGILRTLNHPSGWHSVSLGAATAGSSPFIRHANLATFDGTNSWAKTKNVNNNAGNEFWEGGAAAFHGSLPFGRTMVIRIGADGAGYTPSDGDAIQWTFRKEGFDTGQIPEWFTGDNRVARVGLIMDTNVNHPATIELNGVQIDLTDAESFDGDTIADQAINFIKAEIPLNSVTPTLTLGAIATDEANPVFLAIGCVQIINKDNPSGVALTALAENSWHYEGHSQNLQANATNKRYRTADLTRFLNSVFKGREDGINAAFILHASESGSVEDQLVRVDGMIEAMIDAYTASSLTVAPVFPLVSHWRTDNDDRARAQSEVYFTIADTRSGDAGLLSMYGITEGIHLVGTEQEQIDWAEANGYDAIVRLDSTIDVSEMRLIDASNGVHQLNEGGFFFAYLLWQKSEEAGAAGSGAAKALLLLH